MSNKAKYIIVGVIALGAVGVAVTALKRDPEKAKMKKRIQKTRRQIADVRSNLIHRKGQ